MTNHCRFGEARYIGEWYAYLVFEMIYESSEAGPENDRNVRPKVSDAIPHGFSGTRRGIR